MNNKKTIALYGINGLYNYGCEAIVRGTTAILRGMDSSVNIVYFTPRKEDDEKIIKDLCIEVKQVKIKKLGIIKRAINKSMRLLRIPMQFSNLSYKDVVNECDVFVSIGGDIYTIPKHIYEQKKYFYYNPLIEVGKYVKKREKKLIIMGASIGPFGDYSRAIKYYKKGLEKADLILAREKTCVDYLNKLSLASNFCFMLDPAFFVKSRDDSDNSIESKKEYFGINLSSLSISETNGNVTDNEIRKQATMIECIIEKTGLKALLIPHVFSKNRVDNDYEHLKDVVENISDKYKDKVLLVSPTSFLDVKVFLKDCKFVVAARMHFAVNSICEGVPAILLSYSNKSIGMAKLVYGNSKWVLPLNSSAEEVVNCTLEMNEQAGVLSKEINSRVSEYMSNVKKEESYKQLSELIVC